MIKEIDGILNKYPQLNGYVRGFESGAMKAYAYYGQKLETDKFYNCLKVSTTNTNSLKDLIAMYERDLSKNFHPKGTTWEDIIVHEYGHIIEAYLGAKRVGVNNPKWNMSIEDARASFKYLKTGKISKEIIEEAFKNLNIKTAKDKFNITSELSKYATQDTREFLAEAFADAMRNGDNAQDISKEIIKIIDREMKE